MKKYRLLSLVLAVLMILSIGIPAAASEEIDSIAEPGSTPVSETLLEEESPAEISEPIDDPAEPMQAQAEALDVEAPDEADGGTEDGEPVLDGAEALSGSCGADVSYSIEYNSDRTEKSLTIFGSGPMSDYRITDATSSQIFPYTSAPWSGSESYQIASVTVYSGVTHIGDYAFCGDGGLSHVELAGTVGSIGAGAFWGCASLTEFHIPESVTSIGASAFYYCANLETVYLPSGIRTIDSSAFNSCTKLRDVYYNGTEEAWNALVADGIAEYGNDDLLNANIHFTGDANLTLWQNEDTTGQISELIWSCGSFFWDNEAGSYDHFYIKLVRPAEDRLKDADTVEVTLPVGFSFNADRVVSSTTAGLEGGSLVLPVYPVYADAPGADIFSVTAVFSDSRQLVSRLERTLDGVSIKRNPNSGKVYVAEGVSDSVSFDARWFENENGSYYYNHGIAVMDAALSAMAYLTPAEIRTSLYNLGFSEVYVFARENTQGSGSDTVNYSIALRKIPVGRDIVTLVAVPMRGTIGGVEWMSNFNLSDGVEHMGFESAKDVVLSALGSYLSDRDLTGENAEKVKLMLCGHSRAAAVANLLAADFDKQSGGIPHDSVYCYTFATPNGTKDAHISDPVYDNIFNIVYEMDAVPSVAPRWMDYNKYGLTLSLPGPYSSASYHTTYEPAVNAAYQAYTGKEYDPITVGDYVTSIAVNTTLFVFKANLVRCLGAKICKLISAGSLASNASLLPKLQCAHDMLGYLAWMETISGSKDMSLNLANYKVVEVACPVDVEILDASGRSLGRITGNAVQAGAVVPMVVVDEDKIIILPSGADYQVKLTATDAGEMDYSVFEYGEDGLVARSVNAYGVELEKGRTFTASVGSTVGADKSDYKLTASDGDVITPSLEIDETQYWDTDDVEALIPAMLEELDGAATPTPAPTKTPAPEGNVVISGSAGRNATFALYEDGTMIFSGYGALEDYDRYFSSGIFTYNQEFLTVPWAQWKDGGYSDDYHGTKDYRYSIKKVIFESGITHIGAETLFGCSGVTEVVIPDSVTSIGKEAFRGVPCKTITLPKSLTAIGESAFRDAGISGTVDVPAGVKEIADYAFAGCTNIKEVKLHEGLESIGASAFSGCTGFKEFVIPDSVTSLGRGCLGGCTSVTRLHIGGGIKTITTAAFKDLTYLQSITIGEGVVSIESDAFSGCTGLTKIVFPDSLVSIGVNAFICCRALNSVTFGSGLKTIGQCAFESTGLYQVIIPEGVESIGIAAFKECKQLGRVVIPDSVKDLGWRVFDQCSSLETVELGNGITFIPEEAFNQCRKLQSIRLGNSVTGIDRHAFYQCECLSSIEFPDTLTFIGEQAFYTCESLQELTIPDSVTEVGLAAFKGCRGLKTLHLGTGLEVLSQQMFGSCESLEAVSIPANVKEIGYHAFDHCYSLKTVILSEGLISIGTSAFEYCISLESIHLPDSLEQMGDAYGSAGVFGGCRSLKEITIPDSLQVIGRGAFYGCSSLEKVHLGSGVTRIRYQAFANCSSLQSIELPESVSIIENEAFGSCAKLKYVKFTGNAPSFYENSFSGDTLYAFYPGDDDSWNQYNMQQYAGKVTWMPSPDWDADGDGLVTPADAAAYLAAGDTVTAACVLKCVAGPDGTTPELIISTLGIT